MNVIEQYLAKLNDRLDMASDIEEFDEIENEALEVVRYADELYYKNCDFVADYAEDFLMAVSQKFEHVSGFAQEIAERAVKCKKEAEEEAEEAEVHAKECSTPSI